MRRLLLIRHGESEWNAVGRWQGWEDVPLTAEGEAQAQARARSLAASGDGHFAAVRCSDLLRASRTAEIVAQCLGLPAPVAEPGLRERNGGDWQGCTGAEIEARWPGMRDAWRRGELHAPPGGESDDDLVARVEPSLDRAASAVDDGAVLVVTHHGVLRLLSARAGVPPATLIPNLGGRWFTWDRASASLVAGEPLTPLDEPLDETPATE